LIIELFSQLKLNNIGNENCIEIWGRSWCSRKALGKSDLTEFISQVFRAKVWKILIFEWILLLEIQKNWKNCVCEEKLVEPSMCSHLGQQKGYTSKDLSMLTSFRSAFFLPIY
jgi:hypothetical protein